MIIFTVPGEPYGKGRPKFTRTGHAYTPEKTRAYEAKVRACAMQAYRGEPSEEAIAVRIDAYFKIPKSASKKKRALMIAGAIRPLKKPDLDNIEKIILDGMKGVIYNDDDQVVCDEARKMYGEKPQVIVTVSE